jgi:hypothetical protein
MLIATYVFLDTDVFLHENFDYDSPRLASLTSLAASDRIQVFLTDLTVREVRANLLKAIDDAVASMARPHPILRHSTQRAVKQLFIPLERAALEAELLAQFDQFLRAAKVKILPVEPRVLPAVLDRYFDKRPPFGTGKNKAEFPDALALETLAAWCAKKTRVLAVVTHDNGIKAACDNASTMLHFPTLSEYLDAVSSEDINLRSFIVQQLKRRRQDIEEGLKEAFPRLAFLLADADGEVGEVTATSVDFDDDQEDATFIALQRHRAVVEFHASITYEAELTFAEPGSAYFERGRVTRLQNKIEETVTRSTQASFGVEVTYDQRRLSAFRIRKVWFAGSEDIEVTSDWMRRWNAVHD